MNLQQKSVAFYVRFISVHTAHHSEYPLLRGGCLPHLIRAPAALRYGAPPLRDASGPHGHRVLGAAAMDSSMARHGPRCRVRRRGVASREVRMVRARKLAELVTLPIDAQWILSLTHISLFPLRHLTVSFLDGASGRSLLRNGSRSAFGLLLLARYASNCCTLGGVCCACPKKIQ